MLWKGLSRLVEFQVPNIKLLDLTIVALPESTYILGVPETFGEPSRVLKLFPTKRKRTPKTNLAGTISVNSKKGSS